MTRRAWPSVAALGFVVLCARQAGGGGRQGASAADGGDPDAAGAAAAASAGAWRARRHAEGHHRKDGRPGGGRPQERSADHKLLIDNIAEGVRILREKADDTNVRLSTVSQELDAVRQAVSSMPANTTSLHARPGSCRGGERECDRAQRHLRRARCSRTGRPGRPAHLSPEDVRQRLQRLHRRPLRHRDHGVHVVHQHLPAERQGRRRAAEYRAVAVRGRQVRARRRTPFRR